MSDFAHTGACRIRHVVLSLGFLLSTLGSIADASDADLVRVRLASSPVEIQIQAEHFEFLGKNQHFQFQRIFPSQSLQLNYSKDPRSGKLEIHLQQGKRTLNKWPVAQMPLRIEARSARIGKKSVPTQLILDHVQGVIEVRAEVEFTDYLLGVLSREMPGSWPIEALKAQAIATRSYTLSQMHSRTHWSYDLEGSILDQEFEWVTPEKKQTLSLKRWIEAIAATRNQVLRGSTGEVFRAFYHADCGGRTTTPDFVWGPAGDYKSVRDPSCEVRPTNQWKFVAEAGWLRSQLQGSSRSVATATTAGLEFSWIQSLFDQRVTLVEWWDGFTDLRILSGQNFRQLLGFGKLKSLRFQTRQQGRNMVFEGRGFGHGVGLCQWGSKDWAEKGLNSKAILSHYYPLARLDIR